MQTDPNALINTKAPAPRQAEMLRASLESWEYQHETPYPKYAFGPQQWPAERGPVPTALPYVSILVTEGAEFVFRNGAPRFSIPAEDDEALVKADQFLQRVVRSNCLGERWVALAENCGHQGALAVKFSVDLDDEERPVRLSFLGVPQQCRVWFDPHDCERLLMARIQYPFRDLTTGDWYYYREEWTADQHVTYVPKLAAARDTAALAAALPGYLAHLGDGGAGVWREAARAENPFGVVPVAIIRNRREEGNPLGVGDCWEAFRLIDRIALTLHGEDRANQLHSEPVLVVTNGELEDDGPLLPGEGMSVKNDSPTGPPADAKLLEPSGTAREYSHRSIDKWEDLLYKRVGLSRVSTEAVTNKGNMTALAFAMTFARTISTSNRKRELWGDSGMAPFFRNLLIGLTRLGGVAELAGIDEKQLQVSCEWPPYFEQTDDDRKVLTERTVVQVSGGLLTQERGAERVARAEEIPPAEIKTLLAELAGERAVKERERKEFALGDRLLRGFERGAVPDEDAGDAGAD